jgi:hypothetical protein
MSEFDPFSTICTPEDPEPDDEAEHFMLCNICGQAFDCRNLGEVMHHASADHEPMVRPLA